MQQNDSRGGGPGRLDLALIHYPVCNKNREIIGSAVTNLDLHDIARAGRTFGVGAFHVVTPYQDQQELVRAILAHWLTGSGGRYNGHRKEALEIVRLWESLAALCQSEGARPDRILATCARPQERSWAYGRAREALAAGEHLLILFGTAWGLAPEAMELADGFLPPIQGAGDYNHLSVRSAVAITLDRLCSLDRDI